MSRLSDLFSDQALQVLRSTIQEAQGNEVFFLGTTDETGVLQEVDPLARGNDSAVPALLQVASQGDVILHNHPSGQLTPSEADLEAASHYGNLGVGFYIVNNSVDQVYVVVEAFRKPVSLSLEVPEILQLFAPGGALAKKFTDYQPRPAQKQMAKTVATTFNRSQVALIEAATGTGKSLTYLIPAILWAVRNQKRVVVSTNTINLQEQLIHKDIPLLQQVLNCEFNAVLVKGRGNYLCLDKLQAVDQQGKLLLEEGMGRFHRVIPMGSADLGRQPLGSVSQCLSQPVGKSRLRERHLHPGSSANSTAAVFSTRRGGRRPRPTFWW